MEAIVRAATNERWPARITAVIANKPNAVGLARAASLRIRTAVVDHKLFNDRDSFEKVLANKIDHFDADLIILAGFTRILTSTFVKRYKNKILNIHPSLLPSFKGVNTHQRALNSGVVIHGATVHFVNSELDSGTIIAQGAVPVRTGDDVNMLEKRVLAIEHKLYPLAISWFVNDYLHFDGTRVSVLKNEHRWIFLEK